MTDLHEQLRDAIAASVDGAAPSFDVMTAVRRRHRQRMRRLTLAAPAAVMAVAAATLVVAMSARHGPPGHHAPAAVASTGGHDRNTRVFPGGGRLLLANDRSLSWLYPDGMSARIPGQFDGAQVSSGHLLAWRYTNSGTAYYTMNLDGSRQRLLLPAGHSKKLTVLAALLSPDGSTLAYIQQDLASPAIVTDTLWVLNPATGHRADLGAISSLIAWTGSTTILAAAPDLTSLQLISAATGHRTTYLTVTDPALVHAYEHARPGAGPPAYIGSDGITGHGAARDIAVWLAARRHGGTFRPAGVILAGGTPLVTYAPATPEQLSLTWGPHGLVLIRTGAGDNPASSKTYVATPPSPRVSTPWPFGMDGATFSPAGNVIALQDNQTVTFVSTPRPACQHTVRCLNLQPPYPLLNGTVEAWIP
jgi:hypothetical protein